MPRLVRHERDQPYILTEGKFPLAICACGLSKNKPYCDGSHKKAQEERPGETYLCDDAGRTTVKTEY